MEATFGKVEGGNANVEMKHFSTVVVTTEECTPFYDINVKSWYASAVTKAYYNKIVEGDKNKFNPDTAFTRAMLVTMLYNLEGKPEVSTTTPFVDVNSSAWYGKAVNWAYANKIVEGKDKTHFAPTVEISREEMATMLYNYAKYKKYDVTKMNNLTTFIDSKSISSWALNAIKWANAAKIMEGNGNYLNPKSTAVRAEAATLVVNFLEKVQ